MSDFTAPSFRGWVKPGPIPPGALSGTPAPSTDETLDAISGYYRLFQLRDGHRFSTDDVLTAWYGTTWCPSAAHVLDLGSGIGSVATIAAWRLPGSRLVTVEAQEVSVALARKSMAFNGLESRVDVRLGDVRDPAVLRPDEHFDLVLGSPPYFPSGSGVEGDHPQKVACRFELRGSIADYARVASAHLAPGGVFACVFPLQDGHEARVLDAAARADLAMVRRRDVVFRAGDPPMVGLFLLMRRDHLPAGMAETTWREPPLVVRTSGGAVHPEYSAVKLAIGFPP